MYNRKNRDLNERNQPKDEYDNLSIYVIREMRGLVKS